MRTVSSILFLLSLAMGNAFGQETFFTHIANTPPEYISIYCQWDSVFAHKGEEEWDARVHIAWGTTSEEWKAKISTRGRYRLSNCSFPPLELNLKKGELRDHSFQPFDKFKIVTHCSDDDPTPEDLYEELLVYQLYNVLTPYSYHATLLKINYLFPNGKAFQKAAAAILVEPTDELASRIGGRELEEYGVPEDSLDADSYCLNAMYQFMVGNIDWNQTMQKNIKMIGQPGHYHVIPYDFDFSAIVAPPYMRVASDQGQSDYRDRVYKGQFFADRTMATAHALSEKKTEILSFVSAFPYLSNVRKKQINSYLTRFFNFIDNPKTRIIQGTILRY